jgi:hypothetical protein
MPTAFRPMFLLIGTGGLECSATTTGQKQVGSVVFGNNDALFQAILSFVIDTFWFPVAANQRFSSKLFDHTSQHESKRC